MNYKENNTLKWILFALLIIVAVAVMYHFNKPLKEVQEHKIEYPTYRMY